ncbi:MAG: HAD-IB family hydrolase [Nitrospiraceae bacterium]
MTRQTGIAVFDLDHTLSRSDSFLWYLFGFLARRPWRLIRCVHLPVVVLLFGAGWVNNAGLKESFLRAVLGGVRVEELSAWTQVFVDRFIRSQMRREGIAAVQAHRQAGDRLILLTASPDCYVKELGRRLGFDEVICTQIEWKDGRLSGKLASSNMRGREKVEALQDIRVRLGPRRITAYADHQSDLAMLRMVDHAYLVNGRRRIQACARRDSIQCVVWAD